jgi:hypothetical protein
MFRLPGINFRNVLLCVAITLQLLTFLKPISGGIVDLPSVRVPSFGSSSESGEATIADRRRAASAEGDPSDPLWMGTEVSHHWLEKGPGPRHGLGVGASGAPPVASDGGGSAWPASGGGHWSPQMPSHPQPAGQPGPTDGGSDAPDTPENGTPPPPPPPPPKEEMPDDGSSGGGAGGKPDVGVGDPPEPMIE